MICDAVVPIYNARPDVANLMASLKAARHDCVLTVYIIDDASIDDIESLVPPDDAKRRFVYIRNSENIGFAASVNVGLARARNDVVILNSDVLVFDDWIDRLAEACHSSEDIATVTPFSNAATILSYPQTLIENGPLPDVGWDEIDALCKSGPKDVIDIPTGVGFCMYVRRACLDNVGSFDAETFAAGYGEENDFCRRAAARGWRNVAATNVFVWHRGGASFKERRDRLCAEAQQLLHRRFPDYHRRVAAFIKADPLRPYRSRLDAARAARAKAPRRLHLSPQTIAGEKKGAQFVLRPLPSRWRPKWRLAEVDGPDLPNLPAIRRWARQPDILSLLSTCEIQELVMSPECRLPRALRSALMESARQLGLPVHAGRGI